MSINGQAEIFDRGYRAYDGPRAGIWSSMLSVLVVTVQRALGMRRKFRFKVVPLLTIFIAYVPAIVFVGASALLPREFAGIIVQEYAGYFAMISIVMALFSAFVIPEVMGTDRQSGMLGLYLASALTRWHYVVAKFIAIVGVLSLVTTLPSVFQMAGYSFLGIGPEGFVETIKTLVKIVASGFILSIFFGLLGMAFSTLTTRHLFASAGIVIAIVASTALSTVVFESTDAPEWVLMFGLPLIPLELIVRIWGDLSEEPPLDGVSDLVSFGAWFGCCAVFAAVVIIGYKRMEVTK